MKQILTQGISFLACFALLFMLASAGRAKADTIISAQFEDNQGIDSAAVNYSGVEPDAAAADAVFSSSNVWNHLGAGFRATGPVSFSNLLSSTGAQTGVGFSISHIDGAFNTESGLPDTYFFSYNSSQTFGLTGLAPDESFTLFLYAYTENDHRGATFSVGSSSFNTINGEPSSEDAAAVTGEITGVTSATGTITGTWAFDSLDTGGLPETDWSGFQLAVASPATTATPEPAGFMLVGTGLLGLAALIRRKRRVATASVSRRGFSLSRQQSANG
jgi:hypothetical protein